MQPYENDIGGWEVPELIEQQASLTRLALDRIYEILCLPLPYVDDMSPAAQERRLLLLEASQDALFQAHQARRQLLNLSPGAPPELMEVLHEIAAFGTVH
jgi:hypothetical protein